jgi:glutathione synthase/RimK-type ligase-like ATP-grasp enzyme
MKAYLFRPGDMGKKSCEGVAAVSTTGIKVVQSGVDAHPADPHLCIRFGCTSPAPQGRNVLNKLKNMQATMEKGPFRLKLYKAGLSMVSWDQSDDDMGVVHDLPCVIRPRHHQQGQDFYLCKTAREYQDAKLKAGYGWYASTYIEKAAEYRINVLQGRVLCVIEKSAKDESDIVWREGRTQALYWSEWPLDGVKKAIAAQLLSGLDFAGVDVIADAAGNHYVLELNTCPFLEGKYQQQVFAKGFDWVVNNHRDTIPLVAGHSWQNYIHPALSNNARV